MVVAIKKKKQGRATLLRQFSNSNYAFQKPIARDVCVIDAYNATTGDGTLPVRIRRMGAAAVRFLGRFDTASGQDMPATIPATLPAGLFELTQEMTTEYFSNNAAPVNVSQSHTPAGTEMVVPAPRYLNVAAYDGSNNYLSASDIRITAMPSVILTTVSSKGCLFLSFADSGFIFDQPGDFGESPNGGYRPTGIPIPPDYNQIRIEALSGQWQHHPTNDRRSDAAGLADTMPMSRPDIYKAARTGLNSSNINGSTAIRLNALVALIDRGASQESPVIEIGLDKTLTLTSGPAPIMLRLGFHDGYEWSNNQDGSGNFGSIQVRVTFGETIIA